MKYRVLLPAGYEQSGLRYPVLYLLHGAQGDFTNWTEYTHIAKYTEALPLLVVMPDANDSWYVNSASRPQDRYEDYIANDLMTEIDHRYRTIGRRESRAIAGDSMGGYGAVMLGLKYPERFAFAGSFGGAIGATRRKGIEYNELFGPVGSATNRANDIFELADKQAARELPHFWLAWGDADANARENQRLTTFLQQRNISCGYLESSGGHEWEVWDAQLPAMLTGMALQMQLAAQPAVGSGPAMKSAQSQPSSREHL